MEEHAIVLTILGLLAVRLQLDLFFLSLLLLPLFLISAVSRYLVSSSV